MKEYFKGLRGETLGITRVTNYLFDNLALIPPLR